MRQINLRLHSERSTFEFGSFRLVSESDFRLCVSFGELDSDQKHMVVHNQNKNQQRPSTERPGDDKRNGSMFFRMFFPANNLQSVNPKLERFLNMIKYMYFFF